MVEKKCHAVMISVPYQGHITPFVSLAISLASRGITITFVHLEFIHHKLSLAHNHNTPHHQLDVFAQARLSGLDIRYATIGDGLPLDFDRDLRHEDYWSYLVHNFQPLVDQFVGNLMIQSAHDDDLLPNMLVTSTVYAWSPSIADKYNLVCVSFWTEPALVFSLYYHVDLLTQNGHYQRKDEKELEMIDYIPGVETMSTKDLMASITDNSVFASIEEAKKADFILHNTVHELESHTLSALNKYQL